jgi:signal transduction histidine kinase
VKGGLTRRMTVASGLLAVVIGAAFAVLLVSITDLHAAEQHARQSEEELIVANRLERLVIDTETGLRGFIITGQQNLLDPLHSAEADLPGQAATLEQLAADNPDQLARVQRITAAATSYIRDYASPLIGTARRDPAAARTVAVTDEGKQRMDVIRAEFDTFMTNERDLAVVRQAGSDLDANHAVFAAGLGLAGSILLIVLFAVYLTRAIARPVRSAAAMAGRLAEGDLDVRLPERSIGEVGVLERSFNTMAGSLQDSRRELAASRARIVTAADQARRRIERDLHDGIQQRLVSLVLDVRAAEGTVPPDLSELRTQLADVAEGLTEATDDLRDLSRGIHPAILSEAGLVPALKALARRSAIPVELDLDVPTRLPDQVEIAAYYVISEALTNTTKHANATVAQIAVRARNGSVHLMVQDDGVGGATAGQGTGLTGLTDRIEALGGTITITSPADEGTTLRVDLPAEGR